MAAPPSATPVPAPLPAPDPAGIARIETLAAADGYALAVTRYPATPSLRAHLIVAGATGVPQRYYRRFAEHASTRGIETLTLDYRGIGGSRPPRLEGFRMNLLDWARLDLAAAVEAMHDERVPLFWVGHSFGGQALGALPNHRRVRAAAFFGLGAGWHGHMAALESLRVRLFWDLVSPPLVRWKGYLPASVFGLGEDLPLDVYRQWRRWCRYPRYFFDDPQAQGLLEEFAQVHTPILALTALDDPWSTPRSRDAFLEGYRNAPIERVDIDPKPYGGLGHMGYFRAAAQPLWEKTLNWLAGRAARPLAG